MEVMSIAKSKHASLKQLLEDDDQNLYENNELKNLNEDADITSPLNDDQEVFNVDDKIMMLKDNHPWKCTFEKCDRAFKFRCRLKRHEKTHSDEVIYNITS